MQNGPTSAYMAPDKIDRGFVAIYAAPSPRDYSRPMGYTDRIATQGEAEIRAILADIIARLDKIEARKGGEG